MVAKILEPGPQGTRCGEAVCNNITKQQTPIGQLFFQRKMTHFSCASASLPNFFRGFPAGAAVNRPGKWNFKLISWPPYLQKYTLWGCNNSQSASKQAHWYHCNVYTIWIASFEKPCDYLMIVMRLRRDHNMERMSPRWAKNQLANFWDNLVSMTLQNRVKIQF